MARDYNKIRRIANNVANKLEDTIENDEGQEKVEIYEVKVQPQISSTHFYGFGPVSGETVEKIFGANFNTHENLMKILNDKIALRLIDQESGTDFGVHAMQARGNLSSIYVSKKEYFKDCVIDYMGVSITVEIPEFYYNKAQYNFDNRECATQAEAMFYFN